MQRKKKHTGLHGINQFPALNGMASKIGTEKLKETSRLQNMMSEDKDNPDFDSVLEMTGGFGWTQMLNLALLSYGGMCRGAIAVSAVILCKIPPNFQCRDRISDDPCLLEPTCQQFDYTTPDNFTSIVGEWDLVCDRKDYAGLTQSALMIGMMLGTYFLAPLADRYGRWPLMALGNVLIFLAHALAYFSVSYMQFTLARFLVGFGLGGSLASSVWIVDTTHSKWRSAASLTTLSAYGVGIGILAVFAYYFRDWRDLVFYTTCLMIPYILLMRTIPESARWLVSKGRIREAEDILIGIAQRNGIQLSREQLALYRFTEDKPSNENLKNVNVLATFSSPRMRTRMLLLMWLWPICVLVYFGLTFGSSNLGGNMYINVAVSGLIGIPACILAGYLSDRVGRKASFILFTSIGCCGCLGILLLPLQSNGEMTQTQTNLAMVAKLGMSAAFDLLYVYTGELLPTEIRSGALGFCSMIGRIGGVIQPKVSSTGNIFAYTTFGLTTLVSCGLCVILPETLNKSLPDSIQEVEMDSETEEGKDKKKL